MLKHSHKGQSYMPPNTAVNPDKSCANLGSFQTPVAPSWMATWGSLTPKPSMSFGIASGALWDRDRYENLNCKRSWKQCSKVFLRIPSTLHMQPTNPTKSSKFGILVVTFASGMNHDPRPHNTCPFQTCQESVAPSHEALCSRPVPQIQQGEETGSPEEA